MDNNEIRNLTDVVVKVRREADERSRTNNSSADMSNASPEAYQRHIDRQKRKHNKDRAGGQEV